MTTKKYNIVIHYAGAYEVEVSASTKEEAREIAVSIFDEVDERELIANLADIDICDCWEVEE